MKRSHVPAIRRMGSTFRALVLAMLALALALVVAPRQASAASKYPYNQEVYLELNGSWYSYTDCVLKFCGTGAGTLDYSLMGGITYDASTGTLTIAGKGPDKYALSRVYVRTTDGRDVNFTIDVEVDTDIWMGSVYDDLSSRVPDMDVNPMFSNPYGPLFLQSDNGSSLKLRRQNTGGDYIRKPWAAVYAKEGVVVGGDLDLEIFQSWNGVSNKEQPVYGIYSANGPVYVFNKANLDIEVFSGDTGLSSNNPVAAIRAYATNGNEALKLATDGTVSLDAAQVGSSGGGSRGSNSVCLFNPGATNSSGLVYTLDSSSGKGRMPTVTCLYYDGSFAKAGNVVVGATDKMGYTLKNIDNGVRYTANNGKYVTNIAVRVNTPRRGEAWDFAENFTCLTPGVQLGARNAVPYGYYQYKETADDGWHTVSTKYGNAYLPLEPYAVRYYYHITLQDGYSFADSDELTGTCNGNPATLERVGWDGDLGGATAAVFSCEVPVSSLLAPTKVTRVDITNVTTPKPGATPKNREAGRVQTSTSGQLVDNDGLYTWGQKAVLGDGYPYVEWWTRKGSNAVFTGTFVAGTTYVYHAMLSTQGVSNKYEYVFGGSTYGGTLTASVNGFSSGTTATHRSVSGQPQATIVEVTREFTCPASLIDEVGVFDVTEPASGQTAVADGIVADGSVYSIASQGWHKGRANTSSGEDALQSASFTGTFEENAWYTYEVYLKPNTGYSFSSNDIDGDVTMGSIAAYVNGGERDYCHYYSTKGSTHRGEIVVRRAFYVPANVENAITEIELSTDAFGYGKTPGTTATSLTPGVTTASPYPSSSFVYDNEPAAANFAALKDKQAYWMGDTTRMAYNMGILFAAVTEGMVLSPATSFTPGETCLFVTTVDLGDKYFAFDASGSLLTTVTVNGIPAYISPSKRDHTATVTLEYQVPDNANTYWLYVPAGTLVKEHGTTLDESTQGTEDGYTHYVRYAFDPEEEYYIYQTKAQIPEGWQFWKWECISPNMESPNVVLKYPYLSTQHLGSGGPDADVAFRLYTAPKGEVPRDMSSRNYGITVEWANNWGGGATDIYPNYDGTVKLRWPTKVTDNMGTSDTSDDYVLVEGQDYRLSYTDFDGNPVASPTDARTYYAVITGMGAYDGQRKEYYYVRPAYIRDATIEYETGEVDYSGNAPVAWTYWTGEAITPPIKVTYNGMTLVEGVDYTIKGWSNNTAVTTNAYATLEGMGNYTSQAGSNYAHFEIRARDLSLAEVAAIPDQTYTGGYIMPADALRLSFDGQELAEGASGDYQIWNWFENIAVGEARVQLRGLESRGWTGFIEVPFNIVPLDINDPSFVWPETPIVDYSGDYLRLPSSYTATRRTPSDSLEYLDVDYGYEVTGLSDNLFPGTAHATIKGKGNYTGTRTVDFDISLYINDSEWLAVSGIQDVYTYTGSQIAPVPTVSLGSNGHGSMTLAEGRDYTLEYGENTDAGTVGTVKLVSLDDTHFVSEHTVFFDIKPADIAGAAIAPIPAQTHTEYSIEPELTVTWNGIALEGDGVDYTVSYEDNVEVGTATATITGQGNFTGEQSVTFEIVEPVVEHPFVDVTELTAHWEDIEWMYYSGISTGWEMKDGTRQYRPLANVARCDMAAFLYRLAGSPAYTPTEEDMAYFSDVNEKTPHAREVWWMASLGISRGWEMKDGTHQFRPLANVARCDMAAFLYRLAGSPGFTPSEDDMAYFADVTERTAHANEVWWLASTGVSAGWTMKDGTHQFRPLNNVARADMAAFLHRMYVNGMVPEYV